MKNEIYFMPLGGGQSVGASCYYLKLGNSNILLDCGLGFSDGIVLEPDFYTLMQTNFISSKNQINQMFISHAHADHVAFLPKFMSEAPKVPVYMTDMTSVLTKYQLYDKEFIGNKRICEDKRLATLSMMERINTVSYNTKMDFVKYKAAFFQAGHIPGAMMMLFNYKGKNIMYTGDFSVRDTALTYGCVLPENLKVDVMIMCGLHAKHPAYKNDGSDISITIKKIFHALRSGRNVYCRTCQLSKGVEFLKLINKQNYDGFPIYIDKSIAAVAEKLMSCQVGVLSEYNYTRKNGKMLNPHIIIGNDDFSSVNNEYEKFNADFSIHENFDEMVSFIKKYNPSQAVIVHCGKSGKHDEETIEQRIMKDSDCRTQFLFAENNNMYVL